MQGHILAIYRGGLRYFSVWLLIHGARSVIRTAGQKEDRLSQWVTALAARRHVNVAAAALANKTARITRAMPRHNTDHEPDYMAA